jgi:Papain family cysteine protease
MSEQFTLGRLVEFDERSRAFPIRPLMASKAPRSYTWSCNTWLDQRATSACVGFSWAHELIARPAVETNIDANTAYSFYKRAQDLDEWSGNAYEGSSVLGGAKAIAETGRIEEYRWAFGLDDLIMAVGYAGPAVIGVNWYSSMFSPDAKGVIRVGGRVDGGHAILCNGVSVRTEMFRLHNSWGTGWGIGGDAFISFADMGRLLSEQGEACIPVKRVRSN